MHAFGAALAAREVEREMGIGKSDSVCFSAALLHDSGKFVLAASYGAAYAKTLTVAASSRRAIHELELEQFGTHYGEVAGWIGARWQFPESLAEILRVSPLYASYRGSMLREARIIALADQLSCASGFGFAGDPPDRGVDPLLSTELRLRPDAVERLTEQLTLSRDRTARMLQEWK